MHLHSTCMHLTRTLSCQKVTHFEFSEILINASLLGTSLFGTTVYIELLFVKVIVKCLNQDPKIKACYATGAGCLVPEELVEPAKEVCKAWILNKNVW